MEKERGITIINKDKVTVNGVLDSVSTRNKAIKWWNNLSKFSKSHYENKMFGYGEFMEDPRITEPDIIKMYSLYVLM